MKHLTNDQLTEAIDNATTDEQAQQLALEVIDRILESGDSGMYSEVGGSDQEYKGAIIADWWGYPDEWKHLLDSMGYALYFYDEVITCGQGKVWETIPTHYGWEPKFMVTQGGEIITTDDEPSLWIEECVLTDYVQEMAALPSFISSDEIEAEGFVKFNKEQSFVSGWHPGQTDDPKKIAQSLLEDYSEVLFQIDRVGQFDVQFDVWVR